MARFVITSSLAVTFIIVIALLLETDAHVLTSPSWQSISKELPASTTSDQCLVCLNDHCTLPSPQEVILPSFGAAYVSFCCSEGLGGWCNSSFSMSSLTNSSYLYYIWNVTNGPSVTCPPMIDLSSHVDCVPRYFSSPPTMVNDVIAVPEGNCFAAALLCLESDNDSCVAHFAFQPSLLPAQYCHLQLDDLQTTVLPQCSGASICMNGLCEMCPNSLTNWNPCQCTAPNGTVFPCIPCQQSSMPLVLTPKRSYLAQLPNCQGSYACIGSDEIWCAMCPAQSVVWSNFTTTFACSPSAEPISCQPNTQQQYTCPWNATAAWVWDYSNPFSLGASDSACFINNAASGPTPWTFAVIDIGQPTIINNNLRFSAGYIPAGDTDCSNFVDVGSFSCDSDGLCYVDGGPPQELSFPTPPGARAAVVIFCENIWETCKATFGMSVCNLNQY